MRYLGIDYGTRTVGLALSDESGAFAFPQGTLPNDARLVGSVAALAREKGVQEIVVGDARSLGGAANPITAEVEEFAAALRAVTALPVTLASEAWSSMEAARYAPDNVKRDESAAAVILQRFLDIHRGGSAKAKEGLE
ncbi:hypothetical protein COU20_01720 [Candidatus Kaiserbacteria bacterium CG10_big_fil_rev_8_21_14_0_10_59_10]|uniref:Putative pre-16S rRNA nuclease n=1 Tax=Candidatus Kaiserbacteria bacterium CG10_big_fil_rev_8_21_14_0_10_59_10 TaxID=1974612 RepID=A0A2H0U7V9_9BACT|nr:MAG: hypothetical protein COU20_01720 [Candidatus Kaiserbacteria bacterium CG10_big_fil_rev_8_21_14_0_10_59_10]